MLKMKGEKDKSKKLEKEMLNKLFELGNSAFMSKWLK